MDDKKIEAETVFISVTANGFTGDRTWYVMMDDVFYDGARVSD